MTEYTLEDIKNYRPPAKLHPIAGKTYDLYDAAGFKLTPEAIQELRLELQGYHGDLKALTDALCGLAAFIMFAMEVRNDPAAAEAIANLIKEQRSEYEVLGRSLQGVLQDLAKKAGTVFEKFTGKEKVEKSRAPKIDEKAPEGAVPLKALANPAQPPLHLQRAASGVAKPKAKPPEKKKK